MKNIFFETFGKSIVPDVFSLLTLDINSAADVKKTERDEIYVNEGKYIEIVGMKKRMDLFKWFLPIGIIDAIVFKQKMKFNNRVFTIYD